MSSSIVIPAFMAERYLEDAIASVLAQTRSDWDLVVVDDGSTDRTGEIADAVARSCAGISVVHQPNSGVGASRERGLSESDRGHPFVLFLDADDMLERNSLEVLEAMLEAHAHAPAAHGRARSVDETGRPVAPDDPFPSARSGVHDGRLYATTDDRPTTREMLVVENCVRSAGAVLIRKQALTEVGTWDDSIAGTADWDMWFRLAGQGGLAFTRRVVLRYRRHGDSMSGDRPAMRRAGLRMRRLWLAGADAPTTRLIHDGYRVMVRLLARRELTALGGAVRQRRWADAWRELPSMAFAAVKVVPGVARVVLAPPAPRLGAEGGR